MAVEITKPELTVDQAIQIYWMVIEGVKINGPVEGSLEDEAKALREMVLNLTRPETPNELKSEPC